MDVAAHDIGIVEACLAQGLAHALHCRAGLGIYRALRVFGVHRIEVQGLAHLEAEHGAVLVPEDLSRGFWSRTDGSRVFGRRRAGSAEQHREQRWKRSFHGLNVAELACD